MTRNSAFAAWGGFEPGCAYSVLEVLGRDISVSQRTLQRPSQSGAAAAANMPLGSVEGSPAQA